MKISNRHIFWIKTLIHIVSWLFIVLLVLKVLSDDFGADPVKGIEHFTGKAALNTLLITLLVSPLAKIIKQGFLIRVRRVLGLYCFFWALIHLSVYFYLDLGFNWGLLGSEIVSRPYLTIGAACVIIFFILTITSTHSMQRYLGKKWQKIHNWVYVALILGVIHYYMSVKSAVFEPSIYIGLTSALIIMRWNKLTKPFVNYFNRLKLSANDYSSFAGGELICIKTELETHNVKSYILKPKGMVNFKYIAGQFVTLTLNINGKKYNRSYTISNPPSISRSFIKITVKAIDDGLVSNWLFNNLNPGDFITVSKPIGNFTVPEFSEKKYLFLSAGVGITPCISMAQELLFNDPTSDIVFIHHSRNYNDIIFDKQLKDAEYINFKRINIIKENNNDLDRSNYEMFLQGSLGKLVPELNQRVVLACGQDRYISSVKSMLSTHGFDLRNFHEEQFKSPTSTSVDIEQSSSTQHNLNIVSHGKSIKINEQQTILDALEKENIPIESACRVGACGTCKCKKSDGNIEMSTHEALTKEELENGYILPCVSFVKSDTMIDLPST